jgi:glycosyltransferase involved in cell wall biosynthesis
MHEHRHLLKDLISEVEPDRAVYDGIDSPYLHYLREPQAKGPMNFFLPFNLWKIRRWEKSLLADVNATAYIAPPDAALSISCNTRNVYVIPNGIYLEGEALSPPTQSEPASLGFLGNMGYAQNIRAALNLYQNIFLPLKKEFPNLKLTIIGRAPTNEIKALAGPDVEVTGTVSSIWPHVGRTTAFVYPMTGGAGLQNKILEAMHVGKPVVTTEICLRSLGARPGEEILIGRNDEEFRNHIRALLKNPGFARDLGLRGKAYVDRTFEMSQVIESFEKFLTGN